MCAAVPVPTVPGDNSHYVEGQSRYIWMPDGDGTPHLVDLEEPAEEGVLMSRNGANNQYWLFTRYMKYSNNVLKLIILVKILRDNKLNFLLPGKTQQANRSLPTAI